MPKRQKESNFLPGEGRPSGGLNLGDFLMKPRQSALPSDDFPCLSSPASSLVSQSSSCWGQSSSNDFTQTLPQLDKSDVANEVQNTHESLSSTNQLSYSIAKTKKGSIPIRTENRNKGKKVTVIFNVSGDARELLKELKHAAGCGGVIKDDTVELQGEKVDLVEKFIRKKMNWKK